MPRLNFRPLLIALYLLTLVTVALAALLFDMEPVVWSKPETSSGALTSTHAIIRNRVRTGNPQDELREIAFTAEDLTTIANFALSRKKLRGYALVSLRGDRLVLLASIKLPIPGFYLNLQAIAEDHEPQALIRKARLGHLALPGFAARGVGWWLMQVTPLGRYGRHIAPLLREVRIEDERLRITMNWSRDALEEAQAMMTDMDSRERMAAYQRRLAEALTVSEGRRYVSLGSLLQPMFALARERSAGDNDAVDENQALILVIAAYVNGRDIAPLLADTGDAPPLAKRGVLLNRRIDVAQHFVASASLATSGHRALADTIGMAKELNDTHSGSGFSFIDLTADRAGAMFGKEAVKSEADARRIQERLSGSADESMFMPSLRGLPENLSPAAFAEQFGGIDSPQFEALKQQIEERIAACGLYL